MRLLAVDIGNTHLTWGIFEGPRFVRMGALHRKADWDLPLAEWEGAEIAGVASVNHPTEKRLRESWTWPGAPRLRWVGRELAIPVEVRVPDPAQVGVDRLLNALAWNRRSSLPAVILDFGTAVTFDVVSAGGAYRGGLILPGPELVARALDLGTSLLPRIEVRPTPEPFGQDTESAMRRGIYGLFRGGVDFHLGELRRSLPAETVFVATGGGAPTFAPWFEGLDEVIPTLTLEGIRSAVELGETG